MTRRSNRSIAKKEVKKGLKEYQERVNFLETFIKNSLEKLKKDLSDTQKEHATLSRGLKDILGLEHWPKMEGSFAEGIVSLVKKHVESVRDKARE